MKNSSVHGDMKILIDELTRNALAFVWGKYCCHSEADSLKKQQEVK